ncbi:MAG: tyrosine--tRNA ligase [Chlamydiia bacterium]|nr:tyrosine--tRNA ligase [Chlamydiia bacterium]
MIYSIFEEMKERRCNFSEGLDLPEFFSKENSIYLGFDPTGGHLHLGHLSVLMTAIKIGLSGKKVYFLMGGATGCIGDPSGKNAERPEIDMLVVEKNSETLSREIERVVERACKHCGQVALMKNFSIINNMDWTKDITLVEFMRNVGKYARVSEMIAKDSVKNRLATTGLSFTEFSYQLLQANDFLYLFDKFGVLAQLGGSDQWGNIVAGIDLIWKKRSKKSLGITVPLLVGENGQKFGKTEGGAVWLFKDKHSAYTIYQYIFNISDERIVNVNKSISFDVSEINEIESNKSREIQKSVAFNLLSLLFGESIAKDIENISSIIHDGDIKSFTKDMIIESLPEDFYYHIDTEKDINIFDILKQKNYIESKSEFKRILASGGVKINDIKIINNITIEPDSLKAIGIDGNVLKISIGNRKKIIVII